MLSTTISLDESWCSVEDLHRDDFNVSRNWHSKQLKKVVQRSLAASSSRLVSRDVLVILSYPLFGCFKVFVVTSFNKSFFHPRHPATCIESIRPPPPVPL